jgi:hypothetical protein
MLRGLKEDHRAVFNCIYNKKDQEDVSREYAKKFFEMLERIKAGSHKGEGVAEVL